MSDTCPALNFTFGNGTITYTNGATPIDGRYRVDTSARFSCNRGFSRSGPFGRICHPTGGWRNTLCHPDCYTSQPVCNLSITSLHFLFYLIYFMWIFVQIYFILSVYSECLRVCVCVYLSVCLSLCACVRACVSKPVSMYVSMWFQFKKRLNCQFFHLASC